LGACVRATSLLCYAGLRQGTQNGARRKERSMASQQSSGYDVRRSEAELQTIRMEYLGRLLLSLRCRFRTCYRIDHCRHQLVICVHRDSRKSQSSVLPDHAQQDTQRTPMGTFHEALGIDPRMLLVKNVGMRVSGACAFDTPIANTARRRVATPW
jgi:hypothetical protein